MKRRGFLGFMGGAAVAGPAMVKEAAAKAAADLSLGKAGMLAGSMGGLAPPGGLGPAVSGSLIDHLMRGRDMLKKLGAMTASDRARLKRRFDVYALDPDIASYRSIAMHAKIDWQRERNLTARLAERHSFWERFSTTGDGYEDEPW